MVTCGCCSLRRTAAGMLAARACCNRDHSEWWAVQDAARTHVGPQCARQSCESALAASRCSVHQPVPVGHFPRPRWREAIACQSSRRDSIQQITEQRKPAAKPAAKAGSESRHRTARRHPKRADLSRKPLHAAASAHTVQLCPAVYSITQYLWLGPLGRNRETAGLHALLKI